MRLLRNFSRVKVWIKCNKEKRMNKTKFLEGLKEALQGEISAAELNNQLLYYERYIDDELKKGRTEEDIFNELGAPRLIARTIIEANGKKDFYENEKVYYEEREKNQNSGNAHQHKFQINGVLALAIGILVVFLVSAVVFSLVSALAPIIIPVIIIVLIISFFQKRQ